MIILCTNARIFLKEVRFNLTVVSGEHLKMKSMTFVSFHRIYFFILSGSWNLSWRTWCSRILGLENLVFSVSTYISNGNFILCGQEVPFQFHFLRHDQISVKCSRIEYLTRKFIQLSQCDNCLKFKFCSMLLN